MDPIVVEAIFGFSILFGAFGLLTALNLRKNSKTNKKKVKQLKQRARGPHAYSAVLRKLEAYRQNIEKLATASDAGVHSHRLEKVLQSFDDWEAYIHRLVDRLLEFEANKLIKHDSAILPKKIRNARFRLERAKDPRLQKEIQETLESYLRQQAQLN
ncbi:MAG: hypothetical protein DWQ04_18995, partial [Chloroflexi bacterium]